MPRTVGAREQSSFAIRTTSSFRPFNRRLSLTALQIGKVEPLTQVRESLFNKGRGSHFWPVNRRGFLIVLSGPSGAGKNSLLAKVLPRVPDLKYSVSATTRPPRPGEIDGVDYFFVGETEFQRMVDQGDLLEWAEFAGYRYGTPRKFVLESIEKGLTVITDIDIQGARQIKQNLPEGVFVFLLPPSESELRKRLQGRGTDSDDAIRRRMKIAEEEIKAVVDYDYWIMNEDLDEASDVLLAIIKAEQSKVRRADF